MDHSRSVPLRRHLIFWVLAAGGLALDLWSKHYMFSQPDLLRGDVWWVWPGHAGFQLSLNEGALFGVGQGNVDLSRPSFTRFRSTCSRKRSGISPSFESWLQGIGAEADDSLS